MLVLMLARVDINIGDTVRYLPNFHDPYRKELAIVERIFDGSRNLFNTGSAATPYWIKVRFKKDNKVSVLNAQSFVLEEARQNVPLI